MKAHCFCWSIKAGGYSCCCRCGLLRLRNDVSQKACRGTCKGKED